MCGLAQCRAGACTCRMGVAVAECVLAHAAVLRYPPTCLQDTNRLSGKAYTGAATFCFIEAIERYGAQQTYAQVLSHMMSALQAATGSAGMNLGSAGSVLSMLLGGGAAAMLAGGGGQTPVLSCDKPIDLYHGRLSL